MPAYRLQLVGPGSRFRHAEETVSATVTVLCIRAIPAGVIAGLRLVGLRRSIHTFDCTPSTSRARVATYSPGHAMAWALVEAAFGSDDARLDPRLA